MKTFYLMDNTSGEMQRVESVSDEVADWLAGQIREAGRDRGTRSKPVVVLSISPEYGAFVKAGKALSLEGEDLVFDSAVELSKHLGLKGNNVASALAMAEHKPVEWFSERDLPVHAARIRGVVFRYLDKDVS